MNQRCATRSPSPALAALLRALCGEPDVHVVAPPLGDLRFARVPALAPNVDPLVGALGALAGWLPNLLVPAVRDSPAFVAAIASLIGTAAGKRILEMWAGVAPAGWGESHAAALIDAAHAERCPRRAAAALIGTTNDAVALLRAVWEIALAVQLWGQATPDDPTAWMNHLASEGRDRLMNALRVAPNDDAACCLPWLPEASAADIVDRIGSEHLSLALAAYAAASPIAHARHTAILSALIQRANPQDLDALTRLAVATGMDAAWTEIVRRLRLTPDVARLVVAAAPWDDAPGDVQDAILSAAPHNDVCAAIAFARGARPDSPPIIRETACAFFATVTPQVWNALPAETQQAWRNPLRMLGTFLAVRSPGHDPAFLANVVLTDDLIPAVLRHIPDDATMRQTLLPVTVRDLSFTAVSSVVAALPAPPNPVGFVQITGRMQEMPPAMRTAARFACDFSDARCAVLAHALAGWSTAETDALQSALPDDARAIFLPAPDAQADALARPDQRYIFRQALDALDTLPPSAALSARHALDTPAAAHHSNDQRDADEEIARALCDHGRIVADIAGGLNDKARSAVLPRWNHPHDESAMSPLAATNPLVAHRLAQALRSRNATAALDALTNSSLEKTLHLWRLLPERSSSSCAATATHCSLTSPRQGVRTPWRRRCGDGTRTTRWRCWCCTYCALATKNSACSVRRRSCGIPTWRHCCCRFCVRICARCWRVTRASSSPTPICSHHAISRPFPHLPGDGGANRPQRDVQWTMGC